MPDETSRPKLEIVRAPRRTTVQAQDFQDHGLQSSLFPERKRGLLIFVYFPDVTDREFLQTLEHAEPSHILELRYAPRFDIGKLNRQLAFEAFATHHSTYVDLTSTLTSNQDRDSLIGQLDQFLRTTHLSFEQPVMFLINRRELNDEFTDKILVAVSGSNAGATQIYEVPRFGESQSASSR